MHSHRTNMHYIDIKVSRFNKQLLKDEKPNLNASTYTLPNETKAIITKLKAFKAPGLDGIQNILHPLQRNFQSE